MGNSGSAVDGADSGIEPGWDFRFLEKSVVDPHATIVMAPFARATYGDFSETSNSNRDVITTRGDRFCGMSNGQSCVCVGGWTRRFRPELRPPRRRLFVSAVVMTDTRSVLPLAARQGNGGREKGSGNHLPFQAKGRDGTPRPREGGDPLELDDKTC